MASSLPRKSTCRIEETPDAVIAAFAQSGFGTAGILMGVWLAVWTAGGMVALIGLVASGLGPSTLFILLWLAIWALAEAGVGAVVLYGSFGELRLTFSEAGLVRRMSALWFSFTWRYEGAHLSSLATDIIATSSPPRTGLSFQYGGRTLAIGLDCPMPDAEEVVRRVLARFPRYGSPTATAPNAAPA